MSKLDRINRLLPSNKPKYIRCYDNGGKSADRYTIVFTRLNSRGYKGCLYFGCNREPMHPQGIGMHGEAPTAIDRPAYAHLGKRVQFFDLPEEVRKCVRNSYRYIWGI